MRQVVKFEGIFSYSTYLDFLRQLPQLDSGETVELDLGDVRFFHPDGATPLVATVRHLVDDLDWAIDVAYPNDAFLADYFDKAGWGPGLVGLPPMEPHFGATYCPLTAYVAAGELHIAISDLLNCLRRQAVYAPGVLDAMEWSVNEIADNVQLHAGEGVVGWLQLLTQPQKGHVEFVVADCGRGVRSSLAEVLPPGSTDRDALYEAIKRGVTRDSRIGLGNGLNGTLRIAKAAGGWVNLHSGTASLRQWNTGDQRLNPNAPHHQGTVVTVTLPTRCPIDVSQALWGNSVVPAYETTHGSDAGVRFVVRDHATTVGTRSAARPLRNAVENLLGQFSDDRVLIDFDGFSVVPSSFADEFIGRLVDSIGDESYRERVVLVNASPLLRNTLDAVLGQRSRLK